MTAYANGDDLVARKDARILGELVGDADTRITGSSLTGNANLLAALADASGQIEAACFIGGRYTADDLNGLSGNSQSLLKRLACDLAFTHLHRRRGYDTADLPEYTQANEMLERLRKGERIFDVEDVKDAGNPQIHTTTASDLATQNLARDRCRLFPARRFPS